MLLSFWKKNGGHLASIIDHLSYGRYFALGKIFGKQI
jgi:hypothetical protein